MGQLKDVVEHKLGVQYTIEDSIFERQSKKKAFSAGVLQRRGELGNGEETEQNTKTSGITKDDVYAIFKAMEAAPKAAQKEKQEYEVYGDPYGELDLPDLVEVPISK